MRQAPERGLQQVRLAGMLWNMKGSRSLGSSNGRAHRVLVLLSLLSLFLIGPLHVWHHTDQSMQGPDGSCLPCATFHKTFWIEIAHDAFSCSQPFAGFALMPGMPGPVEVHSRAATPRAPPHVSF